MNLSNEQELNLYLAERLLNFVGVLAEAERHHSRIDPEDLAAFAQVVQNLLPVRGMGGAA